MKTLTDLKLEFRREFGEYTETYHREYQEWLEEKVLRQMNKEEWSQRYIMGVDPIGADLHLSRDGIFDMGALRTMRDARRITSMPDALKQYPLTPRESCPSIITGEKGNAVFQEAVKVPGICVACQKDVTNCGEIPDNDNNCRGFNPLE